MGGEGGQGLGDGLLVADVGQHPAEHPHCGVRPGGDVQAALGHQGDETDGLQGHRLAAGVGAGDDQGVEPLPQLQVVGHGLLLVDEGVPGPAQAQELVRQFGLAALQL